VSRRFYARGLVDWAAGVLVGGDPSTSLRV